MTKELRHVFEKMFSYVDVNMDDVDMTQDGWYTLYEWTPEQEEDFKIWFAKELKSNNELRKQAKLPYRPNKYMIEKTINSFILMWGWKTKLD